MATIPTKAQIYFGNYSYKCPNLFWQKQLLYTQNPNAILAHIYKMRVLFWHLFLHIPNPTLMGNINIHPSRNTSLTRFIKAHEYYPWQNYSFCRDNQAQGSLTTKPSWISPAHTQNPAVESLLEVTSQISAQTAGAFPIKS